MTEKLDLSKELLRSVSRSFYLSMKVLPQEMREPISLAYLLARATDTIADTAATPSDLRLELLESMRRWIFDKGAAPKGFVDRLKKDFIPHQDHVGEKYLLEHLQECFSWLNRLDRAEQFFVTQVLGHITKGQVWDIQYFIPKNQQSLVLIETSAELEQYTYWVAGSVGEFWTDLGFATGGRDFSYEESVKLKELGRHYGQALQLVNILRDLSEDLKNGRCYLPKTDLLSAGWDEKGDLPPEDILLQVSEKWMQQCREWLKDGEQYAKLIRARRVRYATILPLLIATKTVDLIEKSGGAFLHKKVKVSRWQVRKSMLRALFS